MEDDLLQFGAETVRIDRDVRGLSTNTERLQ